MTHIYLDPHELLAIGRTLESCATEVADLGAGLHASARCPMPAAVEADVDRFMATADAVLDQVAIRLYEEAIEIVERSIVAARGGDAAMPGLVGADPLGSVAIVGGHSEPAFTVVVPEGNAAALATSYVTLGGSRGEPFVVLGPDGRPVPPSIAAGLLGGSTVGGHVSAMPGISLGGGHATVGGHVSATPGISFGASSMTVGGSDDPSSDIIVGGHTIPMGLTHRSDVEDLVELLTGQPTPTTTYVPGRGTVTDRSLEHQAFVNPVGYVDAFGNFTSGAGLLHNSIPDALTPAPLLPNER